VRGLPLVLLVLVSSTWAAENLAVVDLRSELRGDLTMHHFVRVDATSISRSIIAFDSHNKTIERLVYAPRQTTWAQYLALSTEAQMAMLDESVDPNPTRYSTNVTVGTSYRTTKRQLYGVLKQLDNFMQLGKSSDIKTIARLVRSVETKEDKQPLYLILAKAKALFNKREEVRLELEEIKKRIKSTTECPR